MKRKGPETKMGRMALAISLTVPSSFSPGQVSAQAKSESPVCSRSLEVSVEETQAAANPLHLPALQEDTARLNKF